MVIQRRTRITDKAIMLFVFVNWRSLMALTTLDLAAELFEQGVEDLEDLALRIAERCGRTPRESTLANYRSLFRRFGSSWREELRKSNKGWCRDNREAHVEASRKWAESNPARALLGQAKQRAKQRGIPCEMTEEEVSALLATGVCSVTGLPFSFIRDGQNSLKNPWAPSLDRIDRTLGYTVGNVRATCWLFNHMRCDYSDDDILIVARALVEANK